MDIALNSAGTDIDVVDGSARLVVELDAIGQHLGMRLAFVQGESPYDRTAGIPYVGAILGSHPTGAVLFFFEREALGTPGVVAFDDVDPSFDGLTRVFSFTATAYAERGERLAVSFP